jgi:hypothetical protein
VAKRFADHFHVDAGLELRRSKPVAQIVQPNGSESDALGDLSEGVRDAVRVHRPPSP